MSLEEDIKRCEQLIKSKNSSWIGISNQRAISHLIEKVKELEAKLEFKQFGDLDNLNFEKYLNEFIPKQEIKDKIKKLNEQEKELQNSISEKEREEYSDANISYFLCDIEVRRKTLQELL